MRPDAITMPVGAEQTFSVENANVRHFSLSGDRPGWTGCVRLETDGLPANSVRLVTQRLCGGLVFLSADIGSQRSPLVAVVGVD
jgi:hypothetical protein